MADKYANQGFVTVTPTLNTLSFRELATYVSVFEKKAFLINRIEYFFQMSMVQELDAETDFIMFGLSTSKSFSSPGLSVSAIFDFNEMITVLQAAGVSSHVFHMPVVKDLSTLPGGGSLVPSRPIFLWCLSGGLAGAGSVEARIFFTVVDLKAEEYWELVEATRLVGG